MKIAFFWTPAFSAEILSWILKYDNVDTLLTVSQPDKPVWRKKEILPTPVKAVALENNIEVIQPQKLKENTEFFDKLKSLDLDFIVVVAYWKIIPKEILEIPKYGCINIHGSILPAYRWASPVQESILRWDSETGLTIMYMNEKMDEGDMLSVQTVDIDIEDKQKEIFEKFVDIGPKLLIETLEKIQNWQINWQPQNHKEATYCSLIKKEDGKIDFNDSAFNIYNKFRAYNPWPGIYTDYNWKKFTIDDCSFDNDNLVDEGFKIWDVVEMEYEHNILKNWKKKAIAVVCKEGSLILFEVKLEWKKKTDIFDFINWQKDFLDYNFC